MTPPQPQKDLETLMPRCTTKDTHDFPELLDDNDGRCWNCRTWDAIDAYAKAYAKKVAEEAFEAGRRSANPDKKNMTPDELRAYNREAKRRWRARHRLISTLEEPHE